MRISDWSSDVCSFDLKTKLEVMAACNPLDIPCGPILSMKELAEEPSLRAPGTIVEVDHPERGKYLTVGNPIKLSDSPADEIGRTSCRESVCHYVSTSEVAFSLKQQ